MKGLPLACRAKTRPAPPEVRGIFNCGAAQVVQPRFVLELMPLLKVDHGRVKAKQMGELNQVQSEIITADLLFARIMRDYDYKAFRDPQEVQTSWSGPRPEAIPPVRLVGYFGALDQASFDFNRIVSGSGRARR